MMNTLPETASLPAGWTVHAGKLHRTFHFADFVAAFGFMAQVAILSNTMNHHPDWSNRYNRVTIDLVTHDAGDSITAADVALAEQINALL